MAVSSLDDLKDGQQLCIEWADQQDWDRIKGYAKEHGPEVLLGVYSDENTCISVLSMASHHQNVEMVKFALEAGFNNEEAMYIAAHISMNNCDNSTILRLLLEHGLDPNVDLGFEGALKEGFSNLLMSAAETGHIDHAMALLDHGANVSKTVVDPNGEVVSPLAYTMGHGAHDIFRLFFARGAIPTTYDVDAVFCHCLQACKEAKEDTQNTLALVEMSQ